MPIVELSCKMRFCAAHRLHNPNLSDAENVRIFGRCNHVNGHGHNYILEVILKGKIDQNTGMIMNADDIEKIVERIVMTRVDHKYLNMDVPEFHSLIPTAENIAVVIWGWLKPEFGLLLHAIRIYETDDCIATYFGE